MNADDTVLDHLTGPIIGSAMTVSNALGAGFLEKVYENALAHELRKAGLAVAQQRGVTVMYDEIIVGDNAVDLLVEQLVIVELKAIRAVANIHRAQCINYLRAPGLQVCLLLNFGNPRLEIRRIPGLRRGRQCWACGALVLSACIGG
ncbi:MAG TPA: GxxExxY protein [Acetobacteraceae bacterium]|jgi:GxxExxY protein|nr:GxxExxY protein [Acetobacteraceae bacterium]